MYLSKLIGLIVLCSCLIKFVFSHGYMIEPTQRGSLWRLGYNVTKNYNDMSNYCGGISTQYDVNNGRCGVCGDAANGPFDHEAPDGKYASGVIVKNYTQGEVISVTVTITANHYGYFEFRLCENNEPMKKVEQECFDKNLLEVKNNNQEKVSPENQSVLDPEMNKFRYFLPNKKTGNFTAEVKLPESITCTSCILQWKYHAGNNWGTGLKSRRRKRDENVTNSVCLGCAKRQEEFKNCADIQILNTNGDVVTKTIDTSDTESSAISPLYYYTNIYLIVYCVFLTTNQNFTFCSLF